MSPFPTKRLIHGDAAVVLPTQRANSMDCCICDPAYGMKIDKRWDKNIPEVPLWRAVWRDLKPGAFCTAFGCPQFYHRLALNLEQAGFIIQDQVIWITSTKMVKTNGKLKQAHEPICVAQKPYEKSLAYNIEKWGVGKPNIEDARNPWDKAPPKGWGGGIQRHTYA